MIDGEGSVAAHHAFPNVTRAQWAMHGDMLDHDGRVAMAVGAFLVRGHGRTILVDLGYGPGALGEIATGRMLDSLRSLGVAPPDVTDVLFTHLHRDHVGWASVDGVPQFPNATLRCDAADYAWFVAQQHDGDVADRVRPCENQLETFDATRPLTGITIEPAPGHTPGSVVIVVSAGTRRLAILGDVVHCPVQLLEREWDTAYDLDPNLARRARERIVSELEGDRRAVMAGAHFPKMRFGRLLEAEGRRRWVV